MSKFDQFIEDFDKTLNKDTSTISTLSSPTNPQPEAMEDQPVPGTPNLSVSTSQQQQHQRTASQSLTPTKQRRNSVSSHPLSPNPSSARKKGLNLNIAMSKGSTPRKEHTDMNEVLRKMASSEMKIIELKDELKLLQGRITKEEEELTRLRNKVARNLNKVPKVQKDRSSPEKLGHKDLKNGTGVNGKDGKESYWTKPLTILNQFDQMLQNEFEKLGKDQSEKDDMLKGMSNSLWSFVSDVKQGLLGDEDRPQKMKQDEQQNELNDSNEEELIDFGDDEDDQKIKEGETKSHGFEI